MNRRRTAPGLCQYRVPRMRGAEPVVNPLDMEDVLSSPQARG